MATYSLWNNKGGVGKSYLTFQIAAEYARAHPDRNVLVIDMCPQANASTMLFGGMGKGDEALDQLCATSPRKTIVGYVRDRIASPYHDPHTGANFLIRVADTNPHVPANLYLVPGDEELEILTSRVSNATQPGPDDAWSKVHLWLSDLINDVKKSWNVENATVLIDCNPSFGVYTELAMSSSDRLIIPFSADGSSKRAVRTVLSLLYGITRNPGAQQSEFHVNSQRFRLSVPKIYCYVGNRLTQANISSAKAFRTVVTEIGTEIFNVWQSSPGSFCVHPAGSPAPANRAAFKDMFQFEVVDANSASVVSGGRGIPIVALTAGPYELAGRKITVNQSQLDRQQPNIRDLAARIE
jgi:cellulose biosynthesis protein BcsQ